VKLDGRVRAELADRTRFGDIRLLAETGSTNRDVLESAAAGAPEGLVVAADHQRTGRGRLDRTWDARPGDGLLVSVLLRPDRLPLPRWHLVTAATALAARKACRDVAGVDPEIKWPNDLMSSSKRSTGPSAPAKLAGILAEASGSALAVGLGLNVHGGPAGAAVLDRLAGRRVAREDVLVAWLYALESLVSDWDGVAHSYREGCSTLGRRVAVQLSAGEVVEGRAESIDGDGRLVVRDDGGQVTVVSAGDVTHLRW
jgi:BirA family transcriptional regulator, biotin operon repressor / biotin---[acetyl-CoA-carboxylase] ligase